MTMTTLYGVHGGLSYALSRHPSASPAASPLRRPDDGLPDGESWWATAGGAWTEWRRRRNDWTGRFPCWGDGGPDDVAVYMVADGDSVESWTARECASWDACDDLVHYYDSACWPDDDASCYDCD